VRGFPFALSQSRIWFQLGMLWDAHNLQPVAIPPRVQKLP
jgi:hypothetical protein